SRRRHTRSKRDWSSDVCSSDLSKTLVATTSCWLCGLPVTNKQVIFSQWTIPGKSSLKLPSTPTLIDGATKFYWNGSKATSIAAPHNTEGKHESGRSRT